MLTVVEAPLFVRYAAEVWDDDDGDAFVDWIARHPESGDLIPGTGGLRKVRWSRAGMGKQGGARAVYFIRTNQDELVLLLAYAKAKFDNLSSDYLRRLKETIDGS